MGIDLAAAPTVGVRAEPSRAPAALPSLTRRASLNAVASLLDFGAKAAVTLVVTPILVSGLGRSLYGIWEMLGRFGSYLSVTDGRATEALRLVVAQHQEPSDADLNRRTVGATLAVWVIMLPLVLAAGAAFAWWLAPALTKAPPDLVGQVRTTGLLLVMTFVVTSLGSVPESALRGMNLGYRQMGVQAGISILGGGLAAGAMWMGLGLTGVADAHVLRALAAGLCFWLLARRYVSWFGAARPTRAEVRSLLGMSVWLTAGDAIAKILLASDVLILGAVVAPAAVAAYALTGYAARTALGIHVFTAGAAMPGIGGLLGGGQLARAVQARRELLTLTWLFVTAVGATILLWNRSFVSLWVGESYYAGAGVDLLIVLGLAQTGFIRTDAYIIDAALRPKQRVMVSAAAALLTIGLAIGLTHAFGVVGLCAGVLAGRLVQSVAYPMLVRTSLAGAGEGEGKPALGLARALRLAGVTIVLFAASAALGQRVLAPNWVVWAAGVTATLALCGGIALAGGPSGPERRALQSRLRGIRAGAPRR